MTDGAAGLASYRGAPLSGRRYDDAATCAAAIH